MLARNCAFSYGTNDGRTDGPTSAFGNQRISGLGAKKGAAATASKSYIHCV